MWKERREFLENFALDPNWHHPDSGSTALHHACQHSLELLVSILLAHPGIDVNSKNNQRQTPFNAACAHHSTLLCLRLLLKDLRVNLGEPDNIGGTPLMNAVMYDNLVAIKWWIASGREMDTGEPGNEKTDAVGLAKIFQRETEMFTLLKRFKESSTQTRHEIRKELGINGQFFIGHRIAGI